jgi:hypothetical protein
MDHAINAVNGYFEISLEELYEEWKTGKYARLTLCPSYKQAATYQKAIEVMRKYYDAEYTMPSVRECMENHIWLSKSVRVE